MESQRLLQAGESDDPLPFLCAENGSQSSVRVRLLLADLVHLRFWKEVVEGFQQTDVVDGFAEEIQHLQA
jgi:hypothetical protein